MVALKDGLPLVRCIRGNSTALNSLWLRTRLRNAAIRAGYENWWLAEDLVDGVILYLRNAYAESVIDAHKLEYLVRTALHKSGYDDVARNFCPTPSTYAVSLICCLGDATSMNSTSFFENIGRSIRAFHESGEHHFHLYDLMECTSRLSEKHRGHMSQNERTMKQKIVAFVRDYVGSLRWQRRIWCTVVG